MLSSSWKKTGCDCVGHRTTLASRQQDITARPSPVCGHQGWSCSASGIDENLLTVNFLGSRRGKQGLQQLEQRWSLKPRVVFHSFIHSPQMQQTRTIFADSGSQQLGKKLKKKVWKVRSRRIFTHKCWSTPTPFSDEAMRTTLDSVATVQGVRSR